MSNVYYSREKNIQILIALLKAHNIKKIIVSPGSSNLYFVASIQHDTYFEIYSCIDERSAAYMACGLSAESGEPVVISCTMATAARNYLPGLTEAYYRKLPILALTATEPGAIPGHHIQQVTDRMSPPKDTVKCSFYVRVPHTSLDEWESNVNINEALIELRKHGGGPVHINFEMEKQLDFTEKNILPARTIRYYSYGENLPELSKVRIGIFVGAHNKWSVKLTSLVDDFCERYNAIVLYDQSSNYNGKYGVPFNLISSQKLYSSEIVKLDLLIHIGEVSSSKINYGAKIWRVNIDGMLRDTFRRLENMFEMTEDYFFNYYVEKEISKMNMSLYQEWITLYNTILDRLVVNENSIPFSNLWIANRLHERLLANSVLHLGILNSLRCWNYFMIDKTVSTYANTGGFGIDGCVSTLIGASLANPEKNFYGIVGDLAFFYDMNSIGNRHLGKNVHLMVINNGLGFEFKQYSNDSQKIGMAHDADLFIAANGHYGSKSKNLIRNYAEDLGFCYISASNKEEFKQVEEVFIGANNDKPILFEVFTNDDDEAEALRFVHSLMKDTTSVVKNLIKTIVKK